MVVLALWSVVFVKVSRFTIVLLDAVRVFESRLRMALLLQLMNVAKLIGYLKKAVCC